MIALGGSRGARDSRRALHGLVAAAGIAVLAAAVSSLATERPGTAAFVGAAILLGASVVSQLHPLAVQRGETTDLSLSLVFGVAAVVLFGWPLAAFVVFGAAIGSRLLAQPLSLRAVHDASAGALGVVAAGAVVAPIDGSSTGGLIGQVAGAAVALYATEVVLTAVATPAAESGIAPRILARLRATFGICALMASAALTLVVLWQRSPVLLAAVIGPLVAIVLYQHSSDRARRAMQLALTDPLTGLGNQRHFSVLLERELERAEVTGRAVGLCVLDVDNFKAVNDEYGHPEGDSVLTQIAGRLRHRGDAFRLGGDEFAVVLAGDEAGRAVATAASIVRRVAGTPFAHGGPVTVSAGVAVLAGGGIPDQLVRMADAALYRAKANGKNQVRTYGTEDTTDALALVEEFARVSERVA